MQVTKVRLGDPGLQADSSARVLRVAVPSLLGACVRLSGLPERRDDRGARAVLLPAGDFEPVAFGEGGVPGIRRVEVVRKIIGVDELEGRRHRTRAETLSLPGTVDAEPA